jgi:4-alpha-glucanotransferase
MAVEVDRKLAGLMIPVFALRRPQDLGIGDTTAVKDAIDFCARHQIALLQLLPINETGGDNSPYNAISSIALDYVLLDTSPEAIPFIDPEFFESAQLEHDISKLRQGSVQYAKVKLLKQSLLANAFANFNGQELKQKTQAAQEFENFKLENKYWLEDYALFRTLTSEHGGDARWTIWEDELHTPKGARSWVQKSPRHEELEKELEFWMFVQFIAFQQWQKVRDLADGKKVFLMGDIPFGISRYSADTWANRELFDIEKSGGAPPEPLFQGDEFTRKWGQNWGIPLYRWDEHERENFAWWRNRIKMVTKIFHYFRIDHVLGFYRIYAFPWNAERNWEFAKLSDAEAAARTGGELPKFLPRDDYAKPENLLLNQKAGEKLLKMILEAAGSAGVVAEDLGVVPTYCRPSLAKLGIPGFIIPMFNRFYDGDQSYIPKAQLKKLALATWGTHDHVPLVTFYEHLIERWHGPDGDEGWREVQRLMQYLELDVQNPPVKFDMPLLKAFFAGVLKTPCWLAVFMITDLLALKFRFNEPSTADDSNWSQRLDLPLAEYEQTEPYKQQIEAFSKMIKECDRAPKVQSLQRD